MQRGVSHKSYKKASIKAHLLLQGLNETIKVSLSLGLNEVKRQYQISLNPTLFKYVCHNTISNYLRYIISRHNKYLGIYILLIMYFFLIFPWACVLSYHDIHKKFSTVCCKLLHPPRAPFE